MTAKVAAAKARKAAAAQQKQSGVCPESLLAALHTVQEGQGTAAADGDLARTKSTAAGTSAGKFLDVFFRLLSALYRILGKGLTTSP